MVLVNIDLTLLTPNGKSCERPYVWKTGKKMQHQAHEPLPISILQEWYASNRVETYLSADTVTIVQMQKGPDDNAEANLAYLLLGRQMSRSSLALVDKWAGGDHRVDVKVQKVMNV